MREANHLHDWRLGSLFSGIGGLELGFERTGRFRTVWQVENDAYARAVLARRWPGVPCHEDVRTFDGAPADIIVGGFPCQDISTAGRRAGIDGERSGLWSEYARIIRRVRPRVVVVENVAAILNRGAERVLGDLATSGYDAWWDCIPAAAVGAPHRRDRFFLVANAHGYQVREEPFPIPWGELQAFARRNGGSGSLADAGRLSQRKSDEAPRAVARERDPRKDTVRGSQPSGTVADSGGGGRVGGWWAAEPGVGRVVDGVADWLDRLRVIGNAVVPQVAELVAWRVLAMIEGSGMGESALGGGAR